MYRIVPFVGSEKRLERNPLTDMIEKRRVPSPIVVQDLLGGGDDSVIEPFYTTSAFMHGLDMRNGSPLLLHVVGAGIKPEIRQRDSGYALPLKEKIELLYHELCEDVGKDIIGAFIMLDFVRRHYGGYSHSLRQMSNYGDVAVDPVKEELEAKARKFESKKRSEINGEWWRLKDDKIEELYSGFSNEALVILERAYEGIDFSEKSIIARADDIKKRPYSYIEAVDEEEDLSNSDKRRIKGIVKDNVDSRFSEGVRNILLGDLKRFVGSVYDEVLGLVRNKEWVGADTHLIHPGESLFTATLEKTIYDSIHLGKMREDALSKYKENEDYKDDEPLAIVLEKFADSTSTIAIFEAHHKRHMLHQFRKTSRVLHMGADTIEGLKRLGVNEAVYSTRLEPAILYLLSVLKDITKDNLNVVERRSEWDGSYIPFIEPLRYIVDKKVPDLEGKRLKIKRSRWGLGGMRLML